MFVVKYGTKKFKFDDFNEAMNFCFDNGLDPDRAISIKKAK